MNSWLVDSHSHVDTLTWDNLHAMALAGIRTVVSPAFLSSVRPLSNDVIWEMWEYVLDVQIPRCGQHRVAVHAMLGISMVGTPMGDPEGLYRRLREALERPEVVGIGEIGIEPSAKCCPDLALQEALVRRQVEIGRDAGATVSFHVPNPPDQKLSYTKKLLALCREAGFPVERAAVDHVSEANIEEVLAAGAWAGITVQPWRQMTPEKAAGLVESYGHERIMINSDCGGGPSDPLAVARTALALQQAGAQAEAVEAVCGGNARRFFGLAG
ncbi:MAG: TatD family hydrolase [Spirochaetales bacterium]|nr:TatD family hydrolase [Spirochaetales bacterium]